MAWGMQTTHASARQLKGRQSSWQQPTRCVLPIGRPGEAAMEARTHTQTAAGRYWRQSRPTSKHCIARACPLLAAVT